MNNAVLNVYHAGIAGTPLRVPWPGVWDGPLWTLIFELLCYIAVAVAGVIGLLKRRWPTLVVFALAVAVSALVSYPVMRVETIPQMVARFAVVFAAGALLHQYEDIVPARWWLVALSAAIATLPLAALSWFLVEKRAMSLKSRLKQTIHATAPPETDDDRDATALNRVAERPTPEVSDTA